MNFLGPLVPSASKSLSQLFESNSKLNNEDTYSCHSMSLSYRTPGGSARGPTNRSIIRTSRNININPPVALNEPAIPEPWTDIKEESPEGDSGGECVGNLSTESGSTTGETHTSGSSQLTGRALKGPLLKRAYLIVFAPHFTHSLLVTRYKTVCTLNYSVCWVQYTS